MSVVSEDVPAKGRTAGISGRVRTVIVAVLVVVFGGGGCYAYNTGLPPFGPTADSWSGVFLTNGQAYFGHFYAGPGDYATLTEVYYVLATQLQSQDPKVAPTTQLSLQKLGGEIHGPRQEMKVAKSQILFVEDLRADSPLVQSIAQAKAAPVPVPQAPAPVAPQAPAATAAPTPAASPSASRTPAPSPTPSPSPTR